VSAFAAVARPSRRRVRLLAVSVALNVFLAAALGAFLARPLFAPPKPRYGPMGRMIEALPADDAARMRAALERARPQQMVARDRVSVAQREVSAAIARNPYDEAAVRRALAAWQESWQGLIAEFNGELITALGTVSDEGRARFASAALAEDARRRAGE
jgi:uncharacterized membrane protein